MEDEIKSLYNRLEALANQEVDLMGDSELNRYQKRLKELESDLKKVQEALRIRSDFGTDEVEGFEDALYSLNQAVKSNKEQTKAAQKEQERFARQQQRTWEEIEKSDAKVQEWEEQLQSLFERLQKLDKQSLDVLSEEELQDSKKELKEIAKQLGAFEGRIDSIRGSGGFEEVQEQISKVGATLDKSLDNVKRFGTASEDMEEQWEASVKKMSGHSQEYADALEKIAEAYGRDTKALSRYNTAVMQAQKNINRYIDMKEYEKRQLEEEIQQKRRAGRSTERLEQKQDQLNEEIKEAQKAHSLQNEALDVYDQRMAGATGNTSRFAKANQELKGQIGGLTGAFQKVNARIKQFGAFIAAAMIIQGLTVAMQELVRVIAQYDQALHNLQAIVEASIAQSKQLGETIKNVSRTTKFSATEVARGMQTLGQAGLSMQESMSAIHGVAMLATGTMSRFKETADLVTTTLNAFNLAATESSRIADVFANAVNNSKLTVDKLATSFNYVGAAGQQAGLTLNEVSGTLMTLADNGIRASTSGTGLRRMMLQMIDAGKELTNDLNALGKSTDDLNPKMVGWQKSLENLIPLLWDSERGTVRMGKAVEYFGTRAAQVASVLVRNVADGTAALDKAIDKTFEFGSAAEMASKQEKGLSLMMKNLTDRVKLVAVAIGEAGLTNVLKNIVSVLKTVTTIVETLITTFDGLAGVIGTGLGVGMLTTMVYGLAQAFTHMKARALVLWNTISPMAARITLITAAITGLVKIMDTAVDWHYDLAEAAAKNAEELRKTAQAAQKWKKSLLDAYGSKEWVNTVKRFKEQNEDLAASIEDRLGTAIEDVATAGGLEG